MARKPRCSACQTRHRKGKSCPGAQSNAVIADRLAKIARGKQNRQNRRKLISVFSY